MYNIETTKFEGCYKIFPRIMEDERGSVCKTFNKIEFEKLGLAGQFTEDLIVDNKKNVLRGMHFQVPPYEQEKLVYCIKGNILDVVLDIRAESPTMGEYEIFYLTDKEKQMIYIPKGFAHGYYCVENSIVGYKLTSRYSKQHDKGVLWDKCGIDWPIKNPIVSTKDKLHLSLEQHIQNWGK